MMLYHESQVGALCGVHCLNTLLQGPYFTEVDLAQIAQELDALERQLLEEALPEGEHGNVDASGMFSSQVLSKALEVWGLTTTPITSPEMQGVAEEPQREQAFICNLQEHWLTVRRVAGDWYNFNSIYAAPEALGTFYLAAFLSTLGQQGYTIFVVRGQLPQPAPPTATGPGRWFTPEEARRAIEAASDSRQRGRVNNAVENMFARAAAGGGRLQLRPRAAAGPPPRAFMSGDQDDDDEAIPPGLLQDGWGGGGGGGDGTVHDDEDMDIAAAIAASLQDASQPTTSAAAEAGAGSGSAVPVGASHAHHEPTSSHQHTPAATGASSITAGRITALGGGMPSAAAAGASGGNIGDRAGNDFDLDEDSDLAAAIAASLQDQHPAGTGGGDVGVGVDTQAAQEVVEELQDEPDAGEGVVELAFRLPSGRQMRRFSSSCPTSQLYRFLEKECGLKRRTFTLSLQFPRKAIADDSSNSLSEAGLEHRSTVTVEVAK